MALPGGEYGFYPQFKQIVSGGGGSVPNATATGYLSNGAVTTGHATYIGLAQGGTIDSLGFSATLTTYAQQRYVTSSGEVFWLFLLRAKVDIDDAPPCGGGRQNLVTPAGSVIATWSSPDHPCMGNGGKPAVMPHPFASVFDPARHEIVVVNPNDSELRELTDKAVDPADDRPDRSLLQVILEEYEIDERGGSPDWPKQAVTVGLPPRVDWKRMPEGTLLTPIRKVIPDMGFKRRTLRRK